MAHANIFQKVNKQEQKSPKNRGADLEDTTLETIKVLGEQVLSLREIIEEQHLVIEDLANTVSILKTDQKETNQNLNLAYIDQKDLAKQLRILRSNLDANQYVVNQKEKPQVAQQPVKNDQEIEELFYNNAKKSTVMKNSQASDAIKRTLEELKKLEKPKQRFLAKKAAEEKQMMAAKSPAIKTNRSPAIKAQGTNKLSNEELARKMIFGKTSKLIK